MIEAYRDAVLKGVEFDDDTLHSYFTQQTTSIQKKIKNLKIFLYFFLFCFHFLSFYTNVKFCKNESRWRFFLHGKSDHIPIAKTGRGGYREYLPPKI